MKKIILVTLILLLSVIPAAEAQKKYGLERGTQAPDFEAINYRGQVIKLSDYYSNKPVVLLFYRGGWCYYCNLQLQEYSKKLKEIEDEGAVVIAVSVDKQQKAAETVVQKDIGFEVVSDPSANLLRLYNVVYKVPDELAETYKKEYNIDLEAASGRKDHVIAVSATYILDVGGKIVFASANEDYKVRVGVEDVLEVLRSYGR